MCNCHFGYCRGRLLCRTMQWPFDELLTSLEKIIQIISQTSVHLVSIRFKQYFFDAFRSVANGPMKELLGITQKQVLNK